MPAAPSLRHLCHGERAALDALGTWLRGHFGPRLRDVRLFGSRARGEGSEDSDVDVLVVVDGLTGREGREIAYHTGDLLTEHGVIVSAFAVASDRWEQLVARGRLITREIARDGVPCEGLGAGDRSGPVTEGARRAEVGEALARGEQALRAAETPAAAGLYADALSRAYYLAFHVLRALLASRGLEAKTHAGAIHLLDTELVRPGLLATGYDRMLAGLQRARELADDDPAVDFGADDARAQIADAVRFRDDALAVLRAEGWVA